MPVKFTFDRGAHQRFIKDVRERFGIDLWQKPNVLTDLKDDYEDLTRHVELWRDLGEILEFWNQTKCDLEKAFWTQCQRMAAHEREKYNISQLGGDALFYCDSPEQTTTRKQDPPVVRAIVCRELRQSFSDIQEQIKTTIAKIGAMREKARTTPMFRFPDSAQSLPKKGDTVDLRMWRIPSSDRNQTGGNRTDAPLNYVIWILWRLFRKNPKSRTDRSAVIDALRYMGIGQHVFDGAYSTDRLKDSLDRRRAYFHKLMQGIPQHHAKPSQ